MTTQPLSRTEASHLHAAAAHDGRLNLAATMKPASRERLIARFLREGLITPKDPTGCHSLTAAGYQAINLTPPKPKRIRTRRASTQAASGSVVDRPTQLLAAAPVTPAEVRTSKKAQILDLLAREQGATMAELMQATAWLPHTVRAALSRIRTAGQPLARTARADAATAYRILPVLSPAQARSRSKIRSGTKGTTSAPATQKPAEAAAGTAV